jgi:hypothetical protein
VTDRGLLQGEHGALDEIGHDGIRGATVLLVLPDREDAERIAARLAIAGWVPSEVHEELLAGEDDAEDADWLVELVTAPDGRPAHTRREWLDALAEDHDGFTSDHD